MTGRLLLSPVALALPLFFAQAAPDAIRISVDTRDAPRRILHAHLVIPASPGPLTLDYPKWIPGEHGPTGPVVSLAGLTITASGKTVPWRRDLEEMTRFHIEVPEGATALEVDLDDLLTTSTEGFSQGASSTAQLCVVSWNQLVLYPHGAKAADLTYVPSLRLPAGWRYATALGAGKEGEDGLRFDPVSLEMLVDSPLLAGAHFKSFDLAPEVTPRHTLNVAADSEAALEAGGDFVPHCAQLVRETGALFGARHYRHYDFLLTLSDQVPSFGLEHHESSDNRADEKSLVDDELRKSFASLLPHEMVHSWNGKHRRPADLATPDFESPMRDDLLWVYEGLTNYLGEILAARAGFWSGAELRERIASHAAALDQAPGRKWRPLIDTAVAAPILYGAPGGWWSWRRGVDFYAEGTLLWLEADVTIRKETKGKKSLDDFCKIFHGGQSGPPSVRTYTLEDVVKALGEVAPYDWAGFLKARVYDIAEHPPLDGITGSGWRLAFTDKVPEMQKASESAGKDTDVRYALGIEIAEDGHITECVPGSPAEKAGLASGMKLVAVNGRKASPAVLRAAIKEAKDGTSPIDLLAENGEYYRSYAVEYHGGERYPILERDAARPDLLADIIRPRAKAPTGKQEFSGR